MARRTSSASGCSNIPLYTSGTSPTGQPPARCGTVFRGRARQRFTYHGQTATLAYVILDLKRQQDIAAFDRSARPGSSPRFAAFSVRGANGARTASAIWHR